MTSPVGGLRLVIIAAALAVGPGCGPPDVACTDIAVASLAVAVEDAAGAPVTDATVTAQHEDEAPLFCASSDDGTYVCEHYEVAGAFTVRATKPGFVEARADVTVEEDECHVIPESVVLTLVEDDAGCCCAYVKPGDIDIISEDPASSVGECEARDQGSCVDPTGRFTPHPCCPEATGDRCE